MVCKRIYWYIRLMTFLQIRYALEADGYFNTYRLYDEGYAKYEPRQIGAYPKHLGGRNRTC